VISRNPYLGPYTVFLILENFYKVIADWHQRATVQGRPGRQDSGIGIAAAHDSVQAIMVNEATRRLVRLPQGHWHPRRHLRPFPAALPSAKKAPSLLVCRPGSFANVMANDGRPKVPRQASLLTRFKTATRTESTVARMAWKLLTRNLQRQS
jgi:hypothetical protein